MGRLLPTHAEDVGHAKVGDLDAPTCIEEEIFRLYVSMRDAHGVDIGNAVDDLLEIRVDLSRCHVATLDGRIQIAAPVRTQENGRKERERYVTSQALRTAGKRLGLKGKGKQKRRRTGNIP
jgi:hypothetical protein